MGTMKVLDRTGDTHIAWDPNNADEVASARSQFDELRGKGFIAYSVVERGPDKGAVMSEFDPTAEKVILSPAMVGG